MKIPNKRELQQIAFDHLSYIDFQDFINLYKKCNAKPYSFLVIDTTLPSDNYSRFRKNIFWAGSLVVSNLGSETNGSRLESSCWLCAEVTSLQ